MNLQIALAAALCALAGPAAGGCAGACPYDEDPSIDLAQRLCSWQDHPRNPLIEPPGSEFLLGDPTLVPPREAPDGRWHLFANSLFGVHHHTSADGASWTRQPPALFGTMALRPYVHKEGADFYLFFEKIAGGQSDIRVSRSRDLRAWDAPRVVLRPELSWEQDTTSTVSNPYVVRRAGEYWLYYSAGGVWLADAGVFEPRYIGLARSASLLGPYTRRPTPLLGPDPGDPHRNLGAGSIKLLDHRLGARLVALTNGIYRDSAGRSRSAIRVIQSQDGQKWTAVCPRPVLAPTGEGWKKAFVYGFDTVVVGQQLWAYYNARDDWAPATERVGLSTCDLGCEP